MDRQATSAAALWQQCEFQFDDSIAQMQAIIDQSPNHIGWHMLLQQLVEFRTYARAQQTVCAAHDTEVLYDA